MEASFAHSDTFPEPSSSEAGVRRTAVAAIEASISGCWEQWRSLGASASVEGAVRAQSIIDPEGLVLLTLAVREHERRLDDFLGWWAAVGASLLSVQRLHNLAGYFPEHVRAGVAAFARLAAEAGDRRWKRHQGDGALRLEPRRGKRAEGLVLDGDPALWLRLRAGLGVGAKADLLAYLIGLRGGRATIRASAAALAYTDVSLRTAAQEMTLARFVEEHGERPVSYSVDAAAWSRLLTGSATQEPALPWRNWAGLYAFLAAVMNWAKEGQAAEWSPYVWSSRARDLAEAHRLQLSAVGLRLPDGNRHRGTDYLPVFADAAERVAYWVRDHL